MQINVWEEAKRFHDITAIDLKQNEGGLYDIVKSDAVYWESSINCLSVEQAIKEFEQDMQNYYFELVIEQEYNMQFEELH